MLRIDVDQVQLGIEPLHEIPGQGLHVIVLGEDPHVVRNISVINPDGAYVEDFGGDQSRQTYRARGTDNQFRESLLLNVVDHMQNRREAQILKFGLGELKFSDGDEVLDGNLGNSYLLAGGYDDKDCSRFQPGLPPVSNR